MYSKFKIIAKLEKLKEHCISSESIELNGIVMTGDDKAKLLLPTLDLVSNYFTYDDELRMQVMYVIHQLYGDLIRRGTEYTADSPSPVPSDNFPKGYQDVSIIFSVDGAIEEIMEIDLKIFLASFEIDLTGKLFSQTIASWENKFALAREKELAGLETILNFCKSGGFESGLFIAFEDIKGSTKQCDKFQIAEKIYIENKYYELIEIMCLNIYIPSYIHQDMAEQGA